MNVPDYVFPIVGQRAWGWEDSKLTSLNGEPWSAGLPLVAKCRYLSNSPRGSEVGVARHEPPQIGCTCGIYAIKKDERCYSAFGISGEVYLWGTIVEHEFGWRAQYAYPKTLVLSPWGFWFTRFAFGHRSPSRIVHGQDEAKEISKEMQRCLWTLRGYGADIFMNTGKEHIPLWTKQAGHSERGLERLRNLTPGDLDGLRGSILGQRRQTGGTLLSLSVRSIFRRKAERKKPPGPPPPPPAIPVLTITDLIRIIQSKSPRVAFGV